MPASKSNPLFSRAEKRRFRGKVSKAVRGSARRGLSRIFGIPLPLSGSKEPAATRTRSRGQSASTGVRSDVYEALRGQGYSAGTARKMAAGVQAGDSFESAFRRVMKRNPGELIIFGNPPKVYTKPGVIRAQRAGNPIPAAIISGFEGALGSIGAQAVTSGKKKNPRKRKYALGLYERIHVPDYRSEVASRIRALRKAGMKDVHVSSRTEDHGMKVAHIDYVPYYKATKNPDSLGKAHDLFNTFHHRGSTGTYETQRSAKSRKDFTILGPLVAIGVNPEKYDAFARSMTKAQWEEYKVEHFDKLPHLAFMTPGQIAQVKRILDQPDQYVKDCPQLASSPNGKQLYAITPDGVEIDLRQFDTDVSKDFVDLGDATFVVYIAKKPDRVREWVHELGEDGGSRPRLVLNRLGKKELFFVGGTYTVEGPGILN